MRNVSLAVRVVVLVAVFSVSAVGQQPSRAVFLYPLTSIDLPVEPARVVSEMTLADAAKHNDFPMFDAMYASSPVGDAAAYAELHSFWKWSLTDPVGAFYGDEMHARLAAEYPDYPEFIADYGIIDSHGRAFYPSAETRAFLLRKATTGRAAIVARLFEEPVASPARNRAKTSVVESAPEKATKAIASPVVVVAPPVVTPVVTPVVATPVVSTPAVVVKTAVAKPAVVKPAVVKSAVAKPVAVRSVVVKPVASPLAVVTSVPAPVGVTPKPALVASKRAQSRAPDGRLARGLVLIIAGLIGWGMLSLLLSAPAEDGTKQPAAEPVRMIHLDEKPKKTA